MRERREQTGRRFWVGLLGLASDLSVPKLRPFPASRYHARAVKATVVLTATVASTGPTRAPVFPCPPG